METPHAGFILAAYAVTAVVVAALIARAILDDRRQRRALGAFERRGTALGPGHDRR